MRVLNACWTTYCDMKYEYFFCDIGSLFDMTADFCASNLDGERTGYSSMETGCGFEAVEKYFGPWYLTSAKGSHHNTLKLFSIKLKFCWCILIMDEYM